MSNPSYLYSGVNPSVSALNEALDQIGGGDARVTTMELHCLIGDVEDTCRGVSASREAGSGSVLWPGSASVGIRNIDLPSNAPAAAAMRYFEVTSSSHLVKRDALFLNVLPHDRVYRWISDGFNASVITYGERSSFKTCALFGNSNGDELSPCMARSVLSSLFEEALDSRFTIGLSCWSLCGNETTDLLSPNGQTSRAGEFVSVACPDLSVALSVLAAARQRCPGAQAQDGRRVLQENQRAHFFCRVLVHRPNRAAGRLSCLHLVDLIGTASVGDLSHNRMPEDGRISRRTTSIQLSTLSKVLQEMRDMSREADSMQDMHGNAFSSQVKMTSARESKLTQILAPILQGNSKTFVLSVLMNGEQHYQQSMNTLRALDGITNIRSACHRAQNIPVGALQLVPALSVLPMRMESIQLQDQSYPSAPSHFDLQPIDHGDEASREQDVEERYESHVLRAPKQGMLDEQVVVPGASPRFDSLMQEYQRFQESFDDLLSSADRPPAPSSHDLLEDYHAPLRGSEMLTPYYHTVSGGSPIEELLRQEMENDAAIKARELNERRQQFDRQNFIMHEYAIQDDRRDRDSAHILSMQAAREHLVQSGRAPDVDAMAKEFQRPHLDHQGQYQPPPQSRQSVVKDNDEEIRDNGQSYRNSHHAPQTWDPHRSVNENHRNDRPKNERRGSRDAAASLYSSRDPKTEDPLEEDVPFTAALVSRETGSNPGRFRDGARTIYPVPESDERHFDIDELTGDLKAASDVVALQKLNQSLMNAVRREHGIRKGVEEKLESVISSCEEEKENMSIHIDDLKLEASKLRQVMRRMAGEGPLEDTLKYFEDEMKLLAAENTRLRRRNLFLEDHNEYIPPTSGGDSTIASYDDMNESAGTMPFSSTPHKDFGTPEPAGQPRTPHTGENSSRKIKKTVAHRDVTWTSMDGMTSSSGTETAEIRVLKAALRRSRKDFELLSSKMDEAKRMERRGQMSTKLYEECSKKLLTANSEVERLSKETDFERDLRFQRERDIGILQSELAVLQSSERELRNERSRTLSELAGARQRIRELEIERTKYVSYDRFVQKHTASKWGDKHSSAAVATKVDPAKKSGVWGGGPLSVSKENKGSTDVTNRRPPGAASNVSVSDVLNDSNQHLVMTSFDTPGMASRIMANAYDVATPQLQHHRTNRQAPSAKKSPPPLPVYNQANSKSILKLSGHKNNLADLTESEMERSIAKGVVGVAGLSNAQYLRLEESEPLSPALEQSLLALHDTIALTAPNLLPLVGKLGTDLKSERAMSVQQRAAMLAQMQKQQYEDACRSYTDK